MRRVILANSGIQMAAEAATRIPLMNPAGVAAVVEAAGPLNYPNGEIMAGPVGGTPRKVSNSGRRRPWTRGGTSCKLRPEIPRPHERLVRAGAGRGEPRGGG